MDQQLLQRTRYVLRSRVRKVQTCPNALFVSTCQHLLAWIENHPVLSGTVHYLRNVPGEHKERIEKTLAEATEAMRNVLKTFQTLKDEDGIPLALQYTAHYINLVRSTVEKLNMISDKRKKNILENLGEVESVLATLTSVYNELYALKDEESNAKKIIAIAKQIEVLTEMIKQIKEAHDSE